MDLIEQLNKSMPIDEDLTEAMDSIEKLQVVYHMRTVDMASGLIRGRQYE